MSHGQEFLNYFFPALVVLVLGFYCFTRRARADDRVTAADYTGRSEPAAAPWRWRKPHDHLGISVKDTPNQSIIEFRTSFNGSDVRGGTIGYILFALSPSSLYIVLDGLWSGRPFLSLLLQGIFCFALTAGMGSVLLSTQRQIKSIVRTPESLAIHHFYGPFLSRTLVIPPERIAHVAVSLASFSSSFSRVIKFQPRPLFALIPTQFFLDADAEVASWVAGGISEWVELRAK